MITIQMNGITVEAETEKEARKQLRKLIKAQEAEQIKRAGDYQDAKQKAESMAYRVLARFASGDEFPRAWTFYTPADDWAKHLFQPVANDGRYTTKHKLNTQWQCDAELDHYGNDLIGAVCNGGGFCWLVFLRDRTTAMTECYAIGVHDGVIATAHCPGIRPEQFRNRSQEKADDEETQRELAQTAVA